MSDDLISRQAAIDIERNATVDTNPSHFEAHQKFMQFMDDAEVSSFGRWQWSNGFNTALTAVGIDLEKLPSAQPHWIPVTERLPEDIRPVIVTWCNTDPASYYQYIVGKRFIGVAHYKSGKWYWYSSTTEDFLAEYGRYDGEEFDEAIEVLAWCELPDPWKG